MYGPFGPFGAIERAGFQNEHTRADSAQVSEIDSANWNRGRFLTAISGSLIWINERLEAQLRAWRWGRPVQTFSLIVFWTSQAFLASSVWAAGADADAAVRFDVHALSEAFLVSDSEFHDDELMTIRLSVPVTSEIASADRAHVSEFRYDIQWQQARYPVIEFGPRTRTTSIVDGTIQVKKQADRKLKLGLALNGIDPPGLAGTANVEAGVSNSESNQYQEIPQQDILVASGTTDRGTGVFFRFHRSRQETLEGTRTLNVSFRVPREWQAGLLQVKCRARGERKIAGIWKEPIEVVRSFTLPVYLADRAEARARAVEYVRAETGFRQLVDAQQALKKEDEPSGFESAFRGLLGLADNKTKTDLGFDRSGNHAGIQREPQSRVVRYRVPMSATDVSGRYRNAREQLLQLSR